jgi:Cu/Ag efflux protein CusF
MKKLIVLACAAVVAVMMLAPGSTLSAKAAKQAKGKSHSLTATVESIDMDAKQITIKDEKGESKTAPVLQSALAGLKTVKAGDKVKITCHDNAKGEHEGVSAIKVVKS